MFLPDYGPQGKGWFVCRVSSPTNVTKVLKTPDKASCLRLCRALNLLQSELQALVISGSSMTSKSDLQTASDSFPASHSKPSSSKAPCA